jgi:hypothetical protein
MFMSLASGCTSIEAARPISKAEAIRLADREARRYVGGDLHQFEHWPVFYTAAKGRWYVGYRRQGEKFVDFGVDVYDTKRAWVIVFN